MQSNAYGKTENASEHDLKYMDIQDRIYHG